MFKRLITGCLLLVAGTSFGQSAASKYIDLYKEEAIRKMNEYGIPASIILGVAMHESGSGTSKISKYLNNHFGMKGKGGNKPIPSSYKGYDSVSQSYSDFISLLKKRTQFSKLFDKYGDYDYVNWVKGIQKGGYAHSRTWSSQVLAIIKKYELYQYDNKPAVPMVLIPGTYTPAVSPPPLPTEKTTVYRVKKGDTLQYIAKKFGTSVKTIRTKNQLTTSSLSVGQKLRL